MQPTMEARPAHMPDNPEKVEYLVDRSINSRMTRRFSSASLASGSRNSRSIVMVSCSFVVVTQSESTLHSKAHPSIISDNRTKVNDEAQSQKALSERGVLKPALSAKSADKVQAGRLSERELVAVQRDALQQADR